MLQQASSLFVALNYSKDNIINAKLEFNSCTLPLIVQLFSYLNFSLH